MADLAQLIGGFRVTQALHVAATLGIADLLADGSRTSDELAAATETNADGLYRLLRALATVGVLDELPGRRFELTGLGSGLRSDAPGSLAAYAAYVGRPHHWNAWSALEFSVRSGENAFEHVHGQSAWEYRAEHPSESALFDAWMTEQSRRDAEIVDDYDFTRFRHVVDVGGGRGSFLAAILRSSPDATGTLFDQGHVVAAAPAIDRCTVIEGNFFEEVPRGGDAYVLKSVIHDWGDAEATAILRNCAAALEGRAVVLLVERDLSAPAAAWLDLQMLLMLGGRERTEKEYAALMAAAGLAYAG